VKKRGKGREKGGVGLLLCVTKGEEGGRRREEREKNKGRGACKSDGEERRGRERKKRRKRDRVRDTCHKLSG
jgi:hypothetical protein